MHTIFITLTVLWSYFLLYTMYSKKSKKLELGLLIEVLTCSKSLAHTLVELNKAISLAGITTLCLAFFPYFYENHFKNLIFHTALMLWTHFVYSVYKYYGTKNLPKISKFFSLKDENIKKLSVILGACGEIVLLAG